MMSRLTPFDYVRPESVDDALAGLAAPGTLPLAGGTHLLAELRATDGRAPLVDLQALPLREMTATSGGLTIGAMVTLQELVENTTGLLQEAARREAPRQVRQAATIAGTIAAALPESELVTALLALEARLKLASGEVLPLDTWTPEASALITHVIVPNQAGGTGAARVGRTPADRPIVLVCARAVESEGVLGMLRLAASGVAPRPIRLPDVEETLSGKSVEQALEEIGTIVEWSVDPPSDFRGSAEYRRAVAGVLARRALAQALGRGDEHAS